MAVKAHFTAIPSIFASTSNKQSSLITIKILLPGMFTMIPTHTFFIYLPQTHTSKPSLQPVATPAEVDNAQTLIVNVHVKWFVLTVSG